jgi:glutaredoxin
MTVKQPLILYSRADCHLCELAAAMLDAGRYDWRVVDIDSDPALEEKYSIRVPVILRSGDGRELFFPFDEAALLEFVAGQ